MKVAKVFTCAMLTVLVLSACDAEATDGRLSSTPRCANCGMVVDESSGWRAGALDSAGESLTFDAPKCLMRYEHAHGPLRDAWVIEYYSQERARVDEVLYVLGTDLVGPMGRDLVPVAGREAAERLMRDHHGQAIAQHSELTEAVLEGLFAPRP